MSLEFTQSPRLQNPQHDYVPATLEGRIEAHFIALARDESRCAIRPQAAAYLIARNAGRWWRRILHGG